MKNTGTVKGRRLYYVLGIMAHFASIICLLAFAFSCKNINSDKAQVDAGDTMKAVPKNDNKPYKQEGKLIKFVSKYSFETFKANLFLGNPASPNFRNNEFASDKEYVKFITDGCKKNNVNFGGHYTIIQKSCGAMCENIFIIDRITGKIHTDIRPNDGRYGF